MISDFISTVTCLFYLNHMHAEYAAFLKTVSCPSPQQAAGYSLKIMPSGMLDGINTWADGILGDILIEDGDEYKINLSLVGAYA